MTKPPRFDILSSYINDKKLKILDVGCGNHSPILTKMYFPQCKYYGLNKTKNYNLSDEDFKLIEQFWLLDLTKSDLEQIPDKFFDVVILSHVIEHLINFDNILVNLMRKIKENGLLYIEIPSYHTQFLPSLKKFGVTFNFYDDKTHIRLYTKKELMNIFKKESFYIKKAKIYFKLKKILFLPITMAYTFRKHRLKCLYELWYLTGWCTYIIALKNI